MNITAATAKDIDAICAILAEEMYPEINFGRLSLEKGRAMVMEVLQDGVIWIVWDGDQIAATTGLIQLDCWWWTEDQFVTDRWVFVRPAYRKSRAAFELLKQIRRTAAVSPFPVLISISSPYDTEAKERLFRRYGVKRGNFFEILPLET